MNNYLNGWTIIVTGAPCTGKTSLGSRLAELLNIEFIDLPKIIEELKLYEYLDETSHEYIVDLRRLSSRLGTLLKSKKTVIASVYPVKPRNITIKLAIVLRIRPDVLMRRLLDRGYPDWKIAENISAELVDKILHEAITKYGKEKIVQIDVTGRDMLHLSIDLFSAMSSMRIKDLHMKVDWISELEKDGSIIDILRFLAKSQTQKIT